MNLTTVEHILADCSFNNWVIAAHLDENERMYLQVSEGGVACNYTGQPYEWRGRKWMLSQHMTKSEVVMTALKAVLTAVEHESREQFKYRGRSVYDPHYDVDKLWRLRGDDDAALDTRPLPAVQQMAA